MNVLRIAPTILAGARCAGSCYTWWTVLPTLEHLHHLWQMADSLVASPLCLAHRLFFWLVGDEGQQSPEPCRPPKHERVTHSTSTRLYVATPAPPVFPSRLRVLAVLASGRVCKLFCTCQESRYRPPTTLCACADWPRCVPCYGSCGAVCPLTHPVCVAGCALQNSNLVLQADRSLIDRRDKSKFCSRLAPLCPLGACSVLLSSLKKMMVCFYKTRIMCEVGHKVSCNTKRPALCQRHAYISVAQLLSCTYIPSACIV